ncbi:oligosaccharide flippase family protein [Plantibacter flavus]|uniref:lipopolysaccharide biosynthesis protein n=1 Tax=Plantibacter flavus TaxID=150123 RepID=UPI002377F9C2|nr:oligosaccharide flippase family protein [Plantibacter flavus]MDD9153905.1 oligosaccharide flippase family protein [Plantibacter flavus]
MTSSSSRRLIYGAVGARLITYPLTIGLGLATASILIQRGDVREYAAYTLVASLLPFAAFLDLGYGGAITNWTTKFLATRDGDPSSRIQYVQNLKRALRVVSSIGAIVALLAIGLLFASVGSTASILDVPLPFFAASLLLVAANQPMSALVKVLIGAGKNALWTILQVVQPLFALCAVLILLASGLPAWVAVVPAAALVAMCTVGSLAALRSVRVSAQEIVRTPFDTAYRGKHFADAWPMMIVLVASPLALSSDRILIGWHGSLTDVATYSLAAQLFTPALSLVSTAGMALWPHFAKLRHNGDHVRPWRMMLSFALSGLVICVMLIVFSPLLAEIISGGEIALETSLVVQFSIAFIIQAAQFPLGMYMMHGNGPRLQALLVSVMALIKIGLSILFIPFIGIGGPVLATGVAVLFCQLIPGAVMVKRGRA